jgi:hypothetical protein
VDLGEPLLGIFGTRDEANGTAGGAIRFRTGGFAAAQDDDLFRIPAVSRDPFHLSGEPLSNGCGHADAVIARPAPAAEFQTYLQLIWSPFSIPHSSLAIFCFCFMFTSLEIMIRCAWGEPAPCMDSVR